MFWFHLDTLNLVSHVPLQSCLSLLCSSKHSRVALDLLDAILSLRNNSYWLVKVLYSVLLKQEEFMSYWTMPFSLVISYRWYIVVTLNMKSLSIDDLLTYNNYLIPGWIGWNSTGCWLQVPVLSYWRIELSTMLIQ